MASPVRDAADAADAGARDSNASGARDMDKFRKDARKREIKRNKERRAEARAAAAQSKDVNALTAERERLARAKDAPAPAGARVRVDKIEEKIRFYDKQIEAKKASGASGASGSGGARGSVGTIRPTSTAYAVGAERFYKPEDSVYWHPTLNPSGKPPAGKPQKWKAGIEIDSRVGEKSRAALAAPERDESESESDGEMPPPPGPPPGFELVFPDAPAPRESLVRGEENVESDEDDTPGPPPLGPPPPDDRENGTDDGACVDDDVDVDGDDDDDTPLPPPPMPPPMEVAPQITTVVHRAPMSSMPRPKPPPRRPPPPQRRDAGFFAAPRATVVSKPVNRAEFTTSAAPTATPMVRADQNPALRALVPASVRVKRQEAPEAKRQRTIGRAIDAAPAVAATKSAQDDKYLNFLDEMSTLGAFE